MQNSNSGVTLGASLVAFPRGALMLSQGASHFQVLLPWRGQTMKFVLERLNEKTNEWEPRHICEALPGEENKIVKFGKRKYRLRRFSEADKRLMLSDTTAPRRP